MSETKKPPDSASILWRPGNSELKRYGYLIDRIAERDNLCHAFYKAARGKWHKPDVYAYGKKLDSKLDVLRQEILSGDISVGGYRYFVIHEPKKRHICAAPFEQRVLHHAMMNVCHERFETAQIYDSYASRLGKGVCAAVKRGVCFSRKTVWFAKLDIKSFFDSIGHEILAGQMSCLFKDRRVLDMIRIIVDSYHVSRGNGLPIGNLTSQYMANHYLSGLDHMIKERLKIKRYVRYMDDMVLWHTDKCILMDAVKAVEGYVSDRLCLRLNPVCVNRVSHGLPFLGYILYPETIKLSSQSKRRFVRKMHRYDEALETGKWTQETYQRHVLPLIAFTETAKAKGFRRQVMTK